jgi:inositol transport system substrate-binding protein
MTERVTDPLLPENAKVVYMTGTAGMSVTVDRQEGLHDALEEAGRTDVEFLAENDANFDKAEGMTLMEDWIQSFPEIDAVIAANDQMALGAMEALKAADRLEGIQVIGVDGVEEALAAIKNGEMTMTAFQNCDAQAKACTELLDKLANGEEVSDVLVPYETITADNVDEYM